MWNCGSGMDYRIGNKAGKVIKCSIRKGPGFHAINCLLHTEGKKISLKIFKYCYFMKRYKVLDAFSSFSVQNELGVIKTMDRIQLEHTVIF